MEALHPVGKRHWRLGSFIEALELFRSQSEILRIEVGQEVFGRAGSDDDGSDLLPRE